MTVSEIYVDGVRLPTPAHEGVTISSEKIWSSDTGRTATGKMVGTIVGIKTKVSIKWPPLTMEQVSIIENATGNQNKPFCQLRYTDMTGKTVTKTVYFSSPTYTMYSWANGRQYIENASIEAVEQ